MLAERVMQFSGVHFEIGKMCTFTPCLALFFAREMEGKKKNGPIERAFELRCLPLFAENPTSSTSSESLHGICINPITTRIKTTYRPADCEAEQDPEN